ncbi:ADP-ribosylglycohydrolase family protein [Listeria monocytogenes]|nr:ADP-ribosylglycohydrolase family protein [Listeria monocytogenes]
MESIKEKYLGSLLGIAIGDALGWPQEREKSSRTKNINTNFQEWVKSSGFGKTYTEEIIQAGSYSDDTQLTLATVRALNYTNFLSYFGRIELPSWLLYERGGGGATKRAALSWAKGVPPWKQNKDNLKYYFDAGGNGVIMRILPHAYAKNIADEEMYQKVFLNGISTHGHPRALLSALVYCRAVKYLINKNDQLMYGELVDHLIEVKEEWTKIPEPNNIKDWINASSNIGISFNELWIKTSKEIFEGLLLIKNALSNGLLDNTGQTLAKLDCNNPKVKGSGVVTCLCSIYIASKFSIDPQNGLLEMAFFKGSDTDTNAAATGGLLGAIYGTNWIKEEWYKVQDASYIRLLSEAIPDAEIPEREDMWSLSDSEKFSKKLQLSDEKSDTFKLGFFSDLKIIDMYIINSKVNNKAIYVLRNEFSPTFYCKVGKNSKTDLILKPNNKSSKKDYNISIEEILVLQKTLPERITLSKFISLLDNAILNFENISFKELDESMVKKIARKIEGNCLYKNDLNSFVKKAYLYYKKQM